MKQLVNLQVDTNSNIISILKSNLPNPKFSEMEPLLLRAEGGAAFVRSLRKKCKNRIEAIQFCYNYILIHEKMYPNLGGKELDARYCKHKDRKAGWWD